MGSNDHQIIRPPNTLRAKVGVGGPNAVGPEALAKAEQVIQDLAGNYLEWVEEDLGRIDDAFAGLERNQGRNSDDVEALFRIAHDIKGQGGSFGYDLVTVIGNQLCRFLEDRENVSPSGIEAVRVHIDAIRLVISQRMTGDGGKQGEALLSGLNQVLEKVATR